MALAARPGQWSFGSRALSKSDRSEMSIQTDVWIKLKERETQTQLSELLRLETVT